MLRACPGALSLELRATWLARVKLAMLHGVLLVSCFIPHERQPVVSSILQCLPEILLMPEGAE